MIQDNNIQSDFLEKVILNEKDFDKLKAAINDLSLGIIDSKDLKQTIVKSRLRILDEVSRYLTFCTESKSAKMSSDNSASDFNGDPALLKELDEKNELLEQVAVRVDNIFKQLKDKKGLDNKVRANALEIVNKVKKIEPKNETAITSEDRSNENKRIYVDITNILHMDKDNNGKLKVKNIPMVFETVKSTGFKPKLLADASTKYNVDDLERFEKLISKKIVKLAPAKRTADIYILKYAKKLECKFLTNDQYEDYYDEFGEDWINEHRLTCMLEDGELIID